MLTLLLVLAAQPALAEEGTAAPEASEDVVVEAPRLVGREAWDTAAALSVFTIDGQLRPGVDLGTLVNRAPGVILRRFGDQDDFQGVSIRGSSMRQVAVHMDGIPLNPEGGEAVDLSRWPLRALQRVEVYRGFAPADLGGAAIGGAIDLIPRDDATSLSGGMQGSTVLRLAADAFTGHPAGSVFVQGHASQGEYRYFTDNGTPYQRLDDRWLQRTNNQSAQLSLLGRSSVRLGRLRLTVIDAFMRRREGLPGHMNNPTVTASMAADRNLLGLRVEQSSGAHLTGLSAWWLAQASTYDDRGDELGLGRQYERQQVSHLGTRVHEDWMVRSDVRLGLGGSARLERGRAESLIATDGASPRSRTAETLTAETELLRGGLGVTPVVHGSFLQGADLPSLVSIDPRIGLRYRWGEDTVLRATGGRYLRPPDLTELLGDRGSMLGNPDLQPERGWQWDVGGRQRLTLGDLGSVQADLGHFWAVAQDRIVWVQNSQRTMIPVNFGQTWVQGLEGSMSVAAAYGLGSETSLSYTQSRNLESNPAVANKQLPGVPTWSLWQELSSASFTDRLRLAVDLSHTDGNYWDATNWYRSAPRSLLGASVQLQPGARWPRLEAGVSNLLDVQVQVVDQNPLQPQHSARVVQATTDFAGHPLPGRVWTIGLRWDPRSET
jgi:vitamin B12 transporter